MTRRVPLVTPGRILADEWLTPLGISQYALAKAIGVPARRINEIVHGKRAITADTAVRLAVFFGIDAQTWMNLQTQYDTEIARAAARCAAHDRAARRARLTGGWVRTQRGVLHVDLPEQRLSFHRQQSGRRRYPARACAAQGRH